MSDERGLGLKGWLGGPRHGKTRKETTPESPVSLDQHRIAVLPFANMSPDPSDAYFADGVTEELISTISNISGLQVISRTSVMGYKGVNRRIPEIGRELKVGTVLEGSVRKADNLVRVTAQLIDVGSDIHLWSQSYDKELKNIFALQSEIAKHVADSLRITILGHEAIQIERKPTEKTEAYLLYLKGRQFWNTRSRDGVLKAIEYFTHARDLDPKFALAHVGLADSYVTQGAYRHVEDAEAVAKARPEVLEALKLDDSLSEAHATNGLILRDYDWDWDAALAEFEKSIELNPSYSSAHHWYAETLQITGRLDKALAEVRKAMELDPLSAIIITNVGLKLFVMERYDEAIEYYKKALLVEPNFTPVLDSTALAYAVKGDLAEAKMWWEKWTRTFPELLAESRFGFALLEALAGEREKAIAMLDSAMELPDSKRISRVYVAYFYLVLYDRQRTFDWLNEAVRRHERFVMYIKSFPWFKELHSDPRFLQVLKKMGLDKY